MKEVVLLPLPLDQKVIPTVTSTHWELSALKVMTCAYAPCMSFLMISVVHSTPLTHIVEYQTVNKDISCPPPAKQAKLSDTHPSAPAKPTSTHQFKDTKPTKPTLRYTA